MSLRKRPSPAEGEFLFEIDEQPLEECLTALGGVPLLVRTLRSLDVPGNVRRQVAIKKRQGGFDEATCVESCAVLPATGGDCPGGFEALREDPGLAEMLGHEAPSPEAARKFLYQFHDEEAICQAQQHLPLGRVSAIAAENKSLRGLADVNQELVRELGRRGGQKIATADLDATIIESSKREAQPTCQGSRGYQPMLALWGRNSTWLLPVNSVTAMQDPLSVAPRAWQALPETAEEFCFRGGSACYESGLPDWPRDENREKGLQGLIGFAVSAPMAKPLKGAVLEVSAGKWESDRDEAEAVSAARRWNIVRAGRAPTTAASRCVMPPSASKTSKDNCSPAALRRSTLRWRQTCGTGQHGVCRSGIARSRVRSRRCMMCLRTSWRLE